MYGIFTYLWLTFVVNVGKYTIHGFYGTYKFVLVHSIVTVHMDTYWYQYIFLQSMFVAYTPGPLAKTKIAHS